MPARTSVAIPAKLATEEDLRATPRDGRKYELVDGEIRMSPGGIRHSDVSLALATLLRAFVTEHDADHAFDSSVGFRLPGGNVRSPDASFVARGRFEAGTLPDDFGDLAPDLAVEVLSPSERPRHVLDKVGEYLEAGVRLVWVIDPRKAKAIVYRSLTDVTELGAEGTLDGADVLPGFRCRLVDIL
jgi:Uma2 family endonuclease